MYAPKRNAAGEYVQAKPDETLILDYIQKNSAADIATELEENFKKTPIISLGISLLDSRLSMQLQSYDLNFINHFSSSRYRTTGDKAYVDDDLGDTVCPYKIQSVSFLPTIAHRPR